MNLFKLPIKHPAPGYTDKDQRSVQTQWDEAVVEDMYNEVNGQIGMFYRQRSKEIPALNTKETTAAICFGQA